MPRSDVPSVSIHADPCGEAAHLRFGDHDAGKALENLWLFSHYLSLFTRIESTNLVLCVGTQVEVENA